jgi:hypothetical protein
VALKFVNLCTSAERVKERLLPAGEGRSSKYLLLARESVLEDEGPRQAAPLDRDLAAVVADRSVTFRPGPAGHRWLDADKELIQARLFFSPRCLR